MKCVKNSMNNEPTSIYKIFVERYVKRVHRDSWHRPLSGKIHRHKRHVPRTGGATVIHVHVLCHWDWSRVLGRSTVLATL